MRLDAYCMECLVRHQAELARAHGSGETGYRFLRDSMRALVDAPEGVGAPYMTAEFDRLYAKYYGADDRYAEIRRESNRLMLEKLPGTREKIAASPDPLREALRFAQTGNYIDFGALPDGVHGEVLDDLLAKADAMTIDEDEYRRFRADLAVSERLLYIGDNAGEIVADLALVEVLRRLRPGLSVTYAVRGAPVLNDVTRSDAREVGMDRVAAIVDNGSGIPGTELSMLGGEMRLALEAADLVISKGQGNFETLCPSGRNVYYMFLCKCDRFMKMFSVPRLTGMFLGEARMPAFPAYF